MAMRYIIRREKAEDFTDIKAQFPNLGEKLGTAAEDFRNDLMVTFSPMRQAHYQFITRKTASGWQWICPTIELVAEDEKGLFALTKQFGVAKPSHLAHLPE